MKKLFAMFLAILMASSLAACGNSGSGNAAAGSAAASGSAASSASNAQYTLVIGSTVQDDSASGKALLDYFKPYVEEHSNGQIQVEVQNNSVLGNDQELFEALQLNTIQGDFGPMSTLSSFSADYSVCDLPYLFADKDSAYAALDGDFGAALAKNLPSLGMRLLAYGENAFRNISNSKRVINTMEDLKGLKIRVMQSNVYIATYSALGCNPTPMAFSELYTALQQGTVDGQDNGVVLTYTSKLYEVQKYYTFTGHIYAANAMVFSEQFFQSLPQDLQQVLTDGSLYAMKNQRQMNTQMEDQLIETMKSSGLQVNNLSADETAKFKAATASVWDKFSNTVSADIFKMAESVRDAG